MAHQKPFCDWDGVPHPGFNLWTIGNASEVVPGISSPLFSTLGQRFEYQSALTFARAIGVEDIVPSYPPPTANWAWVVAGRWALNLAWFNAVLSSFSLEGPSGAMAQFITSTDGHDISGGASADRKRALKTWRKVQQVRAGLTDLVSRDHDQIDRLRASERKRNLSRMTDEALLQLILRVGTRCGVLLGHHLIVSLAAAGDYQDRLNKFLDRAIPGHDPALVIVLTSALRDVESAAPAKGAWDVARFVARRKKLLAEAQRLGPNEIAARLASPADKDWEAFAARFAEFIRDFGFRGMGEVDPAYPDWEEEPAFALSTIKAFLSSGEAHNPHRLEDAAARAREKVEKTVLKSVPAAMRDEYLELLSGAQRFTRMRESSKANWVRGDRVLRGPFLELGRRFASRGLLKEPGDIFWLSWDDVQGAAASTLAANDALAAVTRRKREAKRLANIDLPEVFEVPVKAQPRAALSTGKVLQGMGVSAGTATGRARVVLSAGSAEEVEVKEGEILVAPYTDAPWTPLFIPAAAVVVETGGILSHAATVAREFGIPAVVAVKGATQLIKTGQKITVDAAAGTVKLG